MQTEKRQPHATFEQGARIAKARKIHRLLETIKPVQGRLRLLEIGTGSGAIASYFARLEHGDCQVDAVDVLDQRTVAEGYTFQLVAGVELPFADASFDVVISNHVLEHVGDAMAQQRHLSEVARVLRPDGLGYLASPNRWQVIEPHFGLASLSWMPRRWRSAYLRFSGKGQYYDCEPLRMGELEAMLQRVGFDYRNEVVAALHLILKGESAPSMSARVAGRIPDRVLHAFRRICPTRVYLLQHRSR